MPTVSFNKHAGHEQWQRDIGRCEYRGNVDIRVHIVKRYASLSLIVCRSEKLPATLYFY